MIAIAFGTLALVLVASAILTPFFSRSVHTRQQVKPRTDWKLYRNPEYGFAIRYPSRLQVEDILPQNDEKPTKVVRLSATKFYSPEAAPEARIPEDIKSYRTFADQYLFVVLETYHNPHQRPLKQLLNEIYATRSIAPPRTVFQFMEPDLQLYRGGPQGAIFYTGSPLETAIKQVFFLHETQAYVITLLAGPDIGTKLTPGAEETFDLMISSIEFP